jgi:thiol-disulfide isomerase/thioredoxin
MKHVRWTTVTMIFLTVVACLTVFFPASHPSRVNAWQRLPITDLDGKPLASTTWDRRLVLLNFWSTDCAACLAELPTLEKAYTHYNASGLSVVGVALSNEDPDRVAAAAVLSHVTYPQAWDSTGQLDKVFGGIVVVPTTILVTSDGRIAFRQEGPLNDQELDALVRAYGPPSGTDFDVSEVRGPSPFCEAGPGSWWQRAHLFDPRDFVSGSMMPGYPWLFTTRYDIDN